MSSYLPSLTAIESFVKGTVLTAATLSTLGLGLLYYGQSYLIYPSAFPPGSRTDVLLPSRFGLHYEDLELKTSDGVILKCYLIPQKKDLGAGSFYVDIKPGVTEEEFIASRPTVIMFHGNGGNHGHRIPLAAIFVTKMRCNVLMMCYRGYGLSEGSPSEKGFRIDSQTGLDYLTSHPLFKDTPIVLYGQSIGGAVAIDLTSRNAAKIQALILENTFTSIPKLIPHVFPVLRPFSCLCHQKWDSASKIPLIPATIPILMLSGVRDELVPKDHMQALWEAVSKRGEKNKTNGSEHKTGRAKYVELENGTHNDTCAQAGYWAAVAEFITSLFPLTREPEKST